MSIEERLGGLEEYVRRLALLTPTDWISKELAALQRVPETDPAHGAARQAIKLLTAGQALVAEHQAGAPPPAPTPPVADVAELAKKNQALLDGFEREVGISKSYATVVTGAGYAALIALWSGFREHIDRTSLLLSGCLVGVSVAIFAAWEMLKVMLAERAAREYNSVVAKKLLEPDFETSALLVRRSAASAASALNRYQKVVFWTGTVAGFGAAAIIFFAGLAAAVGLKVSFGH